MDLSEATAWIGWQLQRVNGGLVRRQTKTSASDAPLPLPDICIRALEDRRQVEARWRAVAPDWRESGLVFTSRLGTPVDPRNFPGEGPDGQAPTSPRRAGRIPAAQSQG